jgi:hypothetical protein
MFGSPKLLQVGLWVIRETVCLTAPRCRHHARVVDQEANAWAADRDAVDRPRKVGRIDDARQDPIAHFWHEQKPGIAELNALSDFLNSGSIRSTWPARNSCFKPWRARIAV